MNPAMPTLLYIDDDEALARLVDRGLTRRGLRVVHAASGTDGLDRLVQGGIDVVALDQYMPGLDGLETLERIMAIPNAPPVVFVSAALTSSWVLELACRCKSEAMICKLLPTRWLTSRSSTSRSAASAA